MTKPDPTDAPIPSVGEPSPGVADHAAHRGDSTLPATEAQLRAVLAAALDPIVTIDSRGVILSASDSIERVFGWTPPELVGRNVRVLMPEPYHSEHDGYLERYRRTGATNILGRTREYQGKRKNGEVFPIEISVSRADPQGAEPVFVGILRDISERKRLEGMLRERSESLERLVKERTEALQASHQQLRVSDRFASIGTLAAGLGHDMSNILLPILCRLDALEAASLPATSREDLGAVRESVEYLRQLTNALRLLTLDPEDEGDEDVAFLPEWWNQVGSLFGRIAPRSVRLWCEMPDDLPPVDIAPHRLTQAVLNLVVNACEAVGDRGSVRIWARRKGGDVLLAVADDGPGMSPEVQRRAFDPFFTTKKRGLSTGLGLAIVHGVVHRVGGSVEIESAEGNGATVILRLPAASPADRRAAESRGVVAVSLPDARARAYAMAILESQGLDVVAAPPDRPGAVDLWITRASDEAYLAARRFLRAKAGRSVVCLEDEADNTDRWREIGAIVCSRTEGLGGLRTALQGALRARSR